MSELYDFIQTLRRQWYNLTLIENDTNFADSDICALNEKFRCQDTGDKLWSIFTKNKSSISNIKNSDLIRELNKYKNDEISITYFNVDGLSLNGFVGTPGHVWLLIQIYDKYYILQSFIRAYNITSAYGFIQVIDVEEYFDALKDVVIALENSRTGKYNDPVKIRQLADLFIDYTSIDSLKTEEKNHTSNSQTFTMRKMLISNEREFVNDVKNYLCNYVKNLSKNEFKVIHRQATIYPGYIDITYKEKDTRNTRKFLNSLSDHTGLESKNLNLYNVEYLDDPLCEIDKDGNVVKITLNYVVGYNIQKLICEDINTELQCDNLNCETTFIKNSPQYREKRESYRKLVEKKNSPTKYNNLLKRSIEENNSRDFLIAIENGADKNTAARSIGKFDNIEVLNYFFKNEFENYKYAICKSIIQENNFNFFTELVKRDKLKGNYYDSLLELIISERRSEFYYYLIEQNYITNNKILFDALHVKADDIDDLEYLLDLIGDDKINQLPQLLKKYINQNRVNIIEKLMPKYDIYIDNDVLDSLILMSIDNPNRIDIFKFLYDNYKNISNVDDYLGIAILRNNRPVVEYIPDKDITQYEKAIAMAEELEDSDMKKLLLRKRKNSKK